MSVLLKRESFEAWFAETGKTINGVLGEGAVPITFAEYSGHNNQTEVDLPKPVDVVSELIDGVLSDESLAAHAGQVAFLESLDVDLIKD
jgi:hypothetical protein